jgi:hypothetical protein
MENNRHYRKTYPSSQGSNWCLVKYRSVNRLGWRLQQLKGRQNLNREKERKAVSKKVISIKGKAIEIPSVSEILVILVCRHELGSMRSSK